MPWIERDVMFDYDGALRLARELEELADELQGLAVRHKGQADSALGTWVGPTADDYRGATEADLGELLAYIVQLRSAASAWASAYASAANRQAEIDHAREVEAHNRRTEIAAISGDTLLVRPPRPPEPTMVPTGPRYPNTRS